VVTELSRKYTFQVETIKKRDMPFKERRFLNEFPAVAINDTVVFRGRDVTLEELKWMVLREMCKSEHLP
jgi:hypothetical protein